MSILTLGNIGAFCFGLVIGWVTYRTLRRSMSESKLSDITTVIGAIGGGAVTAIFKSEQLFGSYCIGLAIGFFAFFFLYLKLYGKDDATVKAGQIMGMRD